MSIFKSIAMKVLQEKEAWHFYYDKVLEYNAALIRPTLMYSDVLQTMEWTELIKFYLSGI